MADDQGKVLYANVVGIFVSPLDVLLQFAAKFDPDQENPPEVMSRVVLARPVAEEFYHFLGQQLALENPGLEETGITEEEP